MPNDLSFLFAPRSAAVIGASSDPRRIGGRPIAAMLAWGFKGDILPVNPNRKEIQGLRAYPSVAELPEAPDVAIVAVPASAVCEAISELAKRGTSAAVVFTSGFAEMGGSGVAEQERMVAAARSGGMRILGPNTLGMFDLRTGFCGSFMSGLDAGDIPVGRIGVASQSGAYCGHIVSVMRRRGIGIAAGVMTGNEADISLSDVIAHMVADDGIDVIAVYAEGFRDGDRFAEALEKARQARKPVVVMKAGRSGLGGAAARSHTAAIAVNDAIFSSVLAECGAVEARTTEELLDIAQLATRRIYPAGNTLGVITISGGGGVVISDAAEEFGVEMPEMPAAAQKRLKEILPYAAPRNPVDATAQVLNDLSLMAKFAEAVVTEGGYKSILGFLTYTAASPSLAPRLREQFRKLRDAHPDRLYVLCIVGDRDCIAGYENDGFTVFEDPTRAVAAIAAMGRFGDAFSRKPGLPPPDAPAIELPESSPNEAEAKGLLADAGIAVVPEALCRTADEAISAAEKLGFPVVMKIVSPEILHKTEIGGVLLGVVDADAVRRGFSQLIERAQRSAPSARIDGVLVARELKGGVECIVGIHRDPTFGPIAMVGLGGIFVEVLKDVAFHRCPFGIDVAERMILSLKGVPLLLGARGRPKADIAALAEMLSRLSVVGHRSPERLRSVELNPVIVMPEGEGAYAVDAVIEIA